MGFSRDSYRWHPIAKQKGCCQYPGPGRMMILYSHRCAIYEKQDIRPEKVAGQDQLMLPNMPVFSPGGYAKRASDSAGRQENGISNERAFIPKETLAVRNPNGGYACFLVRLFNLHHSVADADMRLDILRRIGILFQLFAKRRHKDAQRGNIVIPTTAPNTLRNESVRQNLSDIP